MPVADIAGGVLVIIFRVIVYIFGEIVIDFFVRGLGFIILRPFSKSTNYDESSVLFVGFIAWIALAILGVQLFGYIQHQQVIDSCLDRGGKFNFEEQLCIK